MLDNEQIRTLQEAAVRAGLHTRADLLAGIPLETVATLSESDKPATQLLRDLDELNRIGRLTDGSLPLEVWLRNALDLAAGKPERQTFRSALRTLLGPGARLPPDEPVRRRSNAGRPRDETTLLERVHSFWVEGVLHSSLRDELRIELSRDERPGAVDRAFDLQVERLDEADRPLDPQETVAEYFERRQRALLILGEPGAGKTITLLELAEGLLASAAADPALPVPVVLHLASWGQPKRPMDDWVVEQLAKGYHVPRRVGGPWLRGGRLAFLFDGLDEVAPDSRVDCVRALNKFRAEHGLSPIAVACRREEYEALGTRLELDAAIQLRALSDGQVDRYLTVMGPPGVSLSEALSGDPSLRDLARSPLMLHVMSLAFAGDDTRVGRAPLSLPEDPDDRRRAIFDRYVERMFARPQGRTPYSSEQTLMSLSWLANDMLARGQGVFLLEQLQPWSLPGGASRALYFMVSRVVGTTALATLASWACWEAMFRGSYSFPILGIDARAWPALPPTWVAAASGVVGSLLGVADYLVARIQPPIRGSWLAPFGVMLGLAATPVLLGVITPDISEWSYWALVLVLMVATFGPRRRKLAAGQDISAMENLRIRWRAVVLLALLLVVLPGAIAVRYAFTSVALQLWTIPSFDSVPMPIVGVGGITFITDERIAVVGSPTGALRAVDLRTGKVRETAIRGEAVFDTTGRTALGYACEERCPGWGIRVWDTETWQVRSTLETPSTWMRWTGQYVVPERAPPASLGHSGTRVVSGSGGYSFWLHNAVTGRLLLERGRVSSFYVTSDDKHVVLHERSGLSILQLENGELAAHFELSTWGNVRGADVHPSGKWFAIVDGDGCIFRLDPASGSSQRLLVGACEAHWGLLGPLQREFLFSPTGDRLAFVLPGQILLLAEDGTLVSRLPIVARHGLQSGLAPPPRIKFSRDGALLLQQQLGAATVHRSSDGAQIGTLPLSGTRFDISPDGSRILAQASYTDIQSLLVSMLLTFMGLPITLLFAFQPGVVNTKTRPNEGIRLTARWSLVVGLGCAVLVAGVLKVVDTTRFLVVDATARWSLPVLVGSLLAFVYGGFDLLQHYVLRAILAARRELPWRSSRFLDGAVRQIFLRRVGGGYIFIHRLLLEYLARDARRFRERP